MIDILISIPLVFLIFKGWKKGLIAEAATLVGLVAGGFAAVHFSQWVAERLNLEGEYTALVAFFLTFIGVVVAAFFIGKCVEGLLKMTHLSFLNHIAGAVLGMLSGVCIVAVLLNGIALIDKEQQLLPPEKMEESRLYEPVFKAGTLITRSLQDFVTEQHALHADEIQELTQ